jgi:hypothetical protein
MTRLPAPLAITLLSMATWIWWPSLTFGQDNSLIDCRVTSGLDGIWKVGFPTRHVVEVESSEPIAGQVSIQTVDGDGVPLVYRDPSWSFELQPGKTTARVEVIASHGRGNRPIRIRIEDRQQKKILVDRPLTESERGSAMPSNQPWVVGIGRDVQLRQTAMKSVGGNWGEYAVSEINQVVDLPSRADAYAGVDAMVFSSSNADINSNIEAPQRKAIREWTERGGQILLTWGENAMTLGKYPEFSAMIPGELVAVSPGCEPAPLESLLGSQQQLKPLTCALVRLKQGRVEVGTLTRDRMRIPIIANWAYGMGSVLWLATEIDSPQVLAWETRSPLVKYLLKDFWETSDKVNTKQSFRSFDELTGQLHSMLDNFSSLRLGNLGQLVLIAGLFALIIGPFDYFIVSRWWKKPRWTWWTLLGAALLTMAGSTMLARAWKPSIPSINAMEVIDWNDETNLLYGRSFIRYYAGRRGVYDFQAHHRSLLPGPAQESKPQPNRIEWLGQPGKSLGGFDSNVTTQLGLPSYEIQSTESDSSSTLVGVGFPAAGTKALMSTWSETLPFDPASNNLTTVSGKDDLLQGSFTNPLSVDLLDATLYFAGRSYTIPAKIRPGERIPISTNIPKDISRRLQRRAFVAGEEQGVAWDPNDTTNLSRLVELFSFHRAAGGGSYTGLMNRYLSQLECSDLLKLERAVVFGFISEPATSWTSRRDEVPVQGLGGKQVTAVRLSFQVKNSDSPGSPSRLYPIPIRP